MRAEVYDAVVSLAVAPGAFPLFLLFLCYAFLSLCHTLNPQFRWFFSATIFATFVLDKLCS